MMVLTPCDVFEVCVGPSSVRHVKPPSAVAVVVLTSAGGPDVPDKVAVAAVADVLTPIGGPCVPDVVAVVADDGGATLTDGLSVPNDVGVVVLASTGGPEVTDEVADVLTLTDEPNMPEEVVIVAAATVVASVVMPTDGFGVPVVDVIGGPDEEFCFRLLVCIPGSSFADAAKPDLTSSTRLASSNSRRRSVSQDLQSIKSPLPITTDLSFRFCGHGPSGSPSQTGIA